MLSKHNIDMVSTRESLKVVNANTESLDFEELESVMWRKASTCLSVHKTRPVRSNLLLFCIIIIILLFSINYEDFSKIGDSGGLILGGRLQGSGL